MTSNKDVNRMKKITGMMLGVVVLFAAEAPAQIVGDNIGSDLQAVWNTASANTMALRAPGNLVSLGRADFAAAHSLAINRSRFGPTVTEPAPTGLTVEQQVRVDVINELFTNVNAALLALLNAIRASGGLTPIVPGSSGLTDLLGNISGAG
jgi:hypothetical protein